MAGAERADDRYAVEISKAPRRERVLRAVGVLTAGALTWGAGPGNPGGRRIVVRDRGTGAVLATRVERAGFDADVVTGIRHDLETLGADEFRARWVDTAAAGG